MELITFLKNKRDHYFKLYLIEKDNDQKNKYLHFYEAYYILYQELTILTKN